MPYLKKEERRVLAKEAACTLLKRGNQFEAITLRMLADEAGMALSTLTYAYSTVDDLLADLLADRREALILSIRQSEGKGRGLRTELRTLLQCLYEQTIVDPVGRELLRYQHMQAMAGKIPSGPWGLGRYVQRVMAGNPQEPYLLPPVVVSEYLDTMIYGASGRFFTLKDPNIWYQDCSLAIDLVVMAALPGTIQMPAYRRLRPPRDWGESTTMQLTSLSWPIPQV